MGNRPYQASKGGSLYLKAGSGAPSGSHINREFDGDIIFQLADGLEFIRIQGDGKVFIRGEVVDDNKSIYKAFAEWLKFGAIQTIIDE